MARRVRLTLGVAARGATGTTGRCLERSNDGPEHHRATASRSLLQDLPEGKGVREFLHQSRVHLSKATRMRVQRLLSSVSHTSADVAKGKRWFCSVEEARPVGIKGLLVAVAVRYAVTRKTCSAKRVGHLLGYHGYHPSAAHDI